MTPEELDEATAKEAGGDPVKAARLAREGWTPTEPVDPDILAFREWMTDKYTTLEYRKEVLAGKWDRSVSAQAFLAGARMAREQERERAKVLVEYAEIDAARLDLDGDPAREALAKYEEGPK